MFFHLISISMQRKVLVVELNDWNIFQQPYLVANSRDGSRLNHHEVSRCTHKPQSRVVVTCSDHVQVCCYLPSVWSDFFSYKSINQRTINGKLTLQTGMPVVSNQNMGSWNICNTPLLSEVSTVSTIKTHLGLNLVTVCIASVIESHFSLWNLSTIQHTMFI